MDNLTLQAESRVPGRHVVRELRNVSRVPAVLYGSSIEPQPISVDAKELHKALLSAGSGLLGLQVGEQATIQVLAREVQRNPINRHALHVDFQAVSMTEKMKLHVPVIQVGEAPVLKNPDVVIVRHLDTVEIECLPSDIPNHLVADISKLVTVDDAVLVGDLVVPAGVEVLTERGHIVVSLSISRTSGEEEAVAAAAVAAEPAEVEVVAKGKVKEEGEE